MSTDSPTPKIKRLSQRVVSCRLIAAIIIILFPLLLVFLLSSVIFGSNQSMIDYKGMDVKNMTLDQMNALIGMKFSDSPVAASETNVITRDKLPEKCRVIPPGHVVTMDFDENRLNVHLDDEGKIKKVKKG